MRVAVLRNPKASKNLKSSGPMLPDDVVSFDLVNDGSLSEVLATVRRATIDVLVIDGGDGTVSRVLSHLPETFGEKLPTIGILSNGNTNLIARKVGAVKNYLAVERLSHLSVADLADVTNTSLVLALTFSNHSHPPLRGFIMGWGAYASGTQIAIEEIDEKGSKQVVRAFAKTVHKALFGKDAAALRAGVATHFEVNGQVKDDRRRFIGIATSFSGSLTAGLNPFWQNGVERGPIRWLDILAPAKWLFLAVPFAAFGKPTSWMKNAGYHSGLADQLKLCVEGGIVVDGDYYETDIQETITISGAERFAFITL